VQNSHLKLSSGWKPPLQRDNQAQEARNLFRAVSPDCGCGLKHDFSSGRLPKNIRFAQITHARNAPSCFRDHSFRQALPSRILIPFTRSPEKRRFTLPFSSAVFMANVYLS
jgi:hypothetical protein